MIKDSGDRTEFETGAKRDMHAGKGRMDLLLSDCRREIVRCRKCGCALTNEAEHILPNVNFRVCIMTCTLSLICPDCGEVEILEMEDRL